MRLSRGLTPARLARVIAMLDPVELMFALKKLRARRAPANQAHVTNLKENPALLAADAAEAAARGFAEVETTVGVSRYAPLNAIAILVGSQTGRPGVLTQCAVEERLNLQLAIQGLVTYAETLSVYGTEPVFVDGDDTPWSKAFLASAYASRGVKVRFTSGGGSEALMGESRREVDALPRGALPRRSSGPRARRASRTARSRASRSRSPFRAARARCSPRTCSPRGSTSRSPPATTRSRRHSAIRKTAKLMGQFLPGTDFVTSGYSAMPRYDNMFGGGNYDADDLDEWLTIQRDWQVDAGIEPLDEDAGAARCASGRRGRCRPSSTRSPSRRSATRRCGSRPRASTRATCRTATAPRTSPPPTACSWKGSSALDVARALDERGFPEVGAAVFELQRQRVAADYLQTSAIIGRDGAVVSAVNDENDYSGPGTGYRLEGERWERLRRLPHAIDARLLGAPQGTTAAVEELSVALLGDRADEVVIAVGPAFGNALTETIGGLAHRDVLAELSAGVRDEGAQPRLVRIRRSADVAFIGHDGAGLSGSGIAVGLQSKGTALIHRAGLDPLDNLELFGMAPSLTLASYRQIGRNAAGYALGHAVAPVPTVMDNFARAKLIVRTTLLHAREAAEVVRGGDPVELALVEALV